MSLDLSNLSSWVWILAGLVIAFVVLRYFLHIAVHIAHLVLGFFWHGCVVFIVLLVIFYALRVMHVF